MSSDPAGVLPVLVTPFDDRWQVDASLLAAETHWVLDNGAHGVTVAMVSEIQRLSFNERCMVAETVAGAAAGRGPVVISVGAESTFQALEYARHADASGATALMAAPPLLSDAPISLDELRRYLSAIAQVSDLPLVLQDPSAYVGSPIAVDVQAALVTEFGPERLLLKPEAVPVGPTVSALLERSRGLARILDGSGGLALMDTYLRGLVGTMPGPDMVWAVRDLWDALEQGDHSHALAVTQALSTVISMVPGLDGYVAFAKHALVRQGVLPSARMRGPVSFRLDAVNETLADMLLDTLRAIVDRTDVKEVAR